MSQNPKLSGILKPNPAHSHSKSQEAPGTVALEVWFPT